MAQESHGDVLEAENTCFLAEKKIGDFLFFFGYSGMFLLKPMMFFFFEMDKWMGFLGIYDI